MMNMESIIGTVIRKMSMSDSSGVSSSSAITSPPNSPGESGSEFRFGSFTSSTNSNNIQGKDTPLPTQTATEAVSSNNTTIKQRPPPSSPRPVIRITVEPVSSEDDSEEDGGSSIFLELSESGTGLSDKTLIEIDGLIDDCGIMMVTCSEVESGSGSDSDQNGLFCGDINDSSYLETGHPSRHKLLARVHSSPIHSHANLSDGSEEVEGDGGGGDEKGDDGGLKVEECNKPKRRNTIADIFRW
jgi:hypothetical protein